MRILLVCLILACVPSLAFAQSHPHTDSPWLKAGIVTLSAIAGADIATTAQAKERGTFREVNFVFEKMFDQPAMLGLANGALTGGVIYTVVQWHRSENEIKRKASYVLIPAWALFRGAVVVNNIRLLREDAERRGLGGSSLSFSVTF
jgi:hypothetical protein